MTDKHRYRIALLEAAETHAPTDLQMVDSEWIAGHKSEALLRWVSLEMLEMLSDPKDAAVRRWLEGVVAEVSK